MSTLGRPKGSYRSAQHESTPFSRQAAPKTNTGMRSTQLAR